jgi:Chromate transporter
MTRPQLRDVTWLFFRIGNTTFGGGNPTIAVLQREFQERGWLTPGSESVGGIDHWRNHCRSRGILAEA